MIEEREFQSILSVAGRTLDVYGFNEASDPPRVTHTEGELTISNKRGVIDIYFQGSLVFRHDPKGEIRDLSLDREPPPSRKYRHGSCNFIEQV